MIGLEHLRNISKVGGSSKGIIETAYDDAVGAMLSKKSDYVIEQVKTKHNALTKEQRLVDRETYRNISGETKQILAKNYYMVKKIENFDYNDSIIQQESKTYFDQVVQLIKSKNLKPTFTKKKVGVCKSGFEVKKDGKEITEYEFDHKSDINMVFAILNRQLGCHVKSNPGSVALFSKMVDRWFDTIFAKAPEIRTYNPMKWIDSRDSFSNMKKRKYLKSILRILECPRDDVMKMKLVRSFKTMVKSGEVYTTTNMNID